MRDGCTTEQEIEPDSDIRVLPGGGAICCCHGKVRNRAASGCQLLAGGDAAAIAFAAVFVQLIIPRRIYKLILRTHGRDVEVLTSTRSKFILDVKRAVEEAFIAHARRSNPDH